MKEKEKKNTIVKRMIFAVAAGFVVGFLMLFLREFLLESGKSGIWKTVDAIFFQDVTKTNGIEGIGILYIVGQLFMRGLQLAIVPLVLTSLSLAMCSLANPERLGKIAGKTFITYICFYVVAAALAGAAAYFVKTMGWFDVQLPNEMVTEAVTMEGYNPLVTVVNAVPSNIFSAFSSNNEIISVVVVAIILGLCMTVLGKKTEPLRKVIENLNDVVQLFLNFLIDKIGPVAIFCMITRTLAVYGIEYIKPTLVWIVTTIVVSLVLVFTIYPVGIFLTTRLNPIPFVKKTLKIGLFAAATNSSAATLPLNTKTCTEELGCSKEISSFVLPTGMTINMNGTAIYMGVCSIFAAEVYGLPLTMADQLTIVLMGVLAAVGTAGVPGAGLIMTTIIFTQVGIPLEAVALIAGVDRILDMIRTSINVVGDVAAAVIVTKMEGDLNSEPYVEGAD